MLRNLAPVLFAASSVSSSARQRAQHASPSSGLPRCRSPSASASSSTGCTRSTGSSAARSPTRSSPAARRGVHRLVALIDQRARLLVAGRGRGLDPRGRRSVQPAAPSRPAPRRSSLQPRPLRRRGDRRGFTARLRDAVDIETVRTDLLEAVNRAVEPTHASVWIRRRE